MRRSLSSSAPFALVLGLVLLASPLAGASPLDASPPVAAGPDPYADALAEITEVGSAMFAWLVDQAVAPDAPSTDDASAVVRGPGLIDVAGIPVITAADLEVLLARYLISVPETDPWGQPYEYRLAANPQLVTDPFAIRAGGPNGAFEGTSYAGGMVDAVDDDLVWVRGMFVRRYVPAGAEQALTAADVNLIGTTMINYVTSFFEGAHAGASGRAPVAAVFCDGVSYTIGSVAAAPTSYATLAADLVPAFLPWLPDVDAWGTAFDFRWNPNGALLGQPFGALRSAGADAAFEGATYVSGTVASLDDDLVWQNGFHHRAPPAPPAFAQELVVDDIAQVNNAMFGWVISQIVRAGGDDAAAAIARGTAPPYDVTAVPSIDHPTLEGLLAPTFLPCVPVNDRWGAPYDYRLNVANLFSGDLLAIRSAGSDGVFEGDAYLVDPVPGGEPDEDLVLANAIWLRLPNPLMLSADGFESGDLSDWSAVVP